MNLKQYASWELEIQVNEHRFLSLLACIEPQNIEAPILVFLEFELQLIGVSVYILQHIH